MDAVLLLLIFAEGFATKVVPPEGFKEYFADTVGICEGWMKGYSKEFVEGFKDDLVDTVDPSACAIEGFGGTVGIGTGVNTPDFTFWLDDDFSVLRSLVLLPLLLDFIEGGSVTEGTFIIWGDNTAKGIDDGWSVGRGGWSVGNVKSKLDSSGIGSRDMFDGPVEGLLDGASVWHAGGIPRSVSAFKHVLPSMQQLLSPGIETPEPAVSQTRVFVQDR